MHRRLGPLCLGAVHPRPQLERRGHTKRRTRADYLWALRLSASSNLYRITDHVRGDRDRGGPRRRTYRRAVGIRKPLDKTALRRKAHVREISERVCGLSAARKTTHSIRRLEDRSWKIEDSGQRRVPNSDLLSSISQLPSSVIR